MLTCYVDTLGDEVLRVAISKARLLQNTNKIIQVTNPLMKYLLEYTEENEAGKLVVKPMGAVYTSERMHFVLCASLLKNLQSEITINTRYRKEIVRGLLNDGFGVYYSQLNELIVGGFYKYLGLNIVFNENTHGLPDIDILDHPFASDVKLFKNNKIALDIAVNSSQVDLERAFRDIKNEILTFYMHTHDIKKMRESLSKFAKGVKHDSFTAYRDEVCSVVRFDSSEDTAAIQIVNEAQNLKIGIKANWPMDEAVVEYKKTVDKATDQALKANKKSLPWIMFLQDANQHAAEMTVVRLLGGFHLQFIENDNIDKVVNYSFSLNGEGKFSCAVDVFQIGENTLGINQDNFMKYLQTLLSPREVIEM
jgi:hypothetical protein